MFELKERHPDRWADQDIKHKLKEGLLIGPVWAEMEEWAEVEDKMER